MNANEDRAKPYGWIAAQADRIFSVGSRLAGALPAVDPLAGRLDNRERDDARARGALVAQLHGQLRRLDAALGRVNTTRVVLPR